MLPDNLFQNLLDLDLQEQIDIDAADAIKTLLASNSNTTFLDITDWTLEDFDGRNILFYKGKNYIPKDLTLRRDIVQMFHDHETAGHPGKLQTFHAVARHYWWPGMRTFIKNYVKGCGTCQQFKINRNPSHPAYIPVEGATCLRPFAHCSMDLITDLPPPMDMILYWSW